MQNKDEMLSEMARAAAHLNARGSITEAEVYRTMLEELSTSIRAIASTIRLHPLKKKAPKKKPRR